MDIYPVEEYNSAPAGGQVVVSNLQDEGYFIFYTHRGGVNPLNR
jgi:hypothetical protein